MGASARPGFFRYHRQRLYWLGCKVFIGCTCGNWVYPCPVVISAQALLEMRRAAARRNVGRFNT